MHIYTDHDHELQGLDHHLLCNVLFAIREETEWGYVGQYPHDTRVCELHGIMVNDLFLTIEQATRATSMKAIAALEKHLNDKLAEGWQPDQIDWEDAA